MSYDMRNVPFRFRTAVSRALSRPEHTVIYGAWHVVASEDNSDETMRVHIWVGNDGPEPTHTFDTPCKEVSA